MKQSTKSFVLGVAVGVFACHFYMNSGMTKQHTA